LAIWFVVAAKQKREFPAHDDFEDEESRGNAPPAVSNGQLLWRTDRYRYCIGAKCAREPQAVACKQTAGSPACSLASSSEIASRALARTSPNAPVPNAPVPNAPVPNAPVPNAPVPNAPVPNAPVNESEFWLASG
jgi:hypothetical protein